MAKKLIVAISDEMHSALEKEAKKLRLGNVQDVARYVFTEYFKGRSDVREK